jgi:parallel beta-helix repeat protein
MKKLLLGILIGAIAAVAGTYIYRIKGGTTSTPAAVATSESSLSNAAGRTSNDGGAALRSIAMSGAVHVVKNGESIQAAVIKAKAGDTIQVMPGLYKETVFIDKDNIAVVGVIKDGEWPVMDGERKLNDAILYSGSGIRIENMKIIHFKGNAIMGQSGNNFVIRHNWIVDTGVYGIFPEFAQNGLIEYNVVSGIEDAAIYVGMSDNIQVSHNEVYASVAGIEIENTRHAIVENNMVYDNAGGILTFITPGLPIKTTFDVIIRDNFVISNNHKNFGAVGSIVSGVPSGTGIIVMAADDVQIENNIIRDNKNAGIIIADHKSFANITIDPEADPSPDRVSIYKNLFANNGYAPIDDVKALMALNLTRKGPDVLAIGDGKGSCILDRSSVKTLNLSSWSDCTKTTSMDVVSYLLAKPVPLRINGSNETAEVGKRLYSAVCAGCHAYNVRMIGPPTQIIQAMYADDAKGIAEYIANPIKKREDFPAMPPQSHLSAEHRLAVAKYMLDVKN